MTTLTERIAQELTQAMRARDTTRVDTLRMAKTAFMNRELERRAPLDDAEAVRVLQGLVKQREDSIEQFTRGGRPELAEQERKEMEVLRGYLPVEASDEEIGQAVEQALRESGGATLKDMGKVMKGALALLKATGKPADGKRVNEAVKRRLSA